VEEKGRPDLDRGVPEVERKRWDATVRRLDLTQGRLKGSSGIASGMFSLQLYMLLFCEKKSQQIDRHFHILNG
jgi:hypothetical protein